MKTILTAAIVLMTLMTLAAQAPLPLRGEQGRGRGAGPAPGRQGQGQPSNLPQSPVGSPVAMASAEVTAPGKMFSSLMPLSPGNDLAKHRYVEKEYFVTGTANGQPYKTRIVVRRPSDNARFSGFVLAESMHPSGNAWMFHFTHAYSMTSGHIALDILTSTHEPFAGCNPERYKNLQVDQGHA